MFLHTEQNVFCTKKTLKLVFAVFYLPIYFLENDSAWKNEKCFLFHLKSFLGCQDIPIFNFI